METSRTRRARRKQTPREKVVAAPLANISRLFISNIKGFDEFSLPIPPPHEDRARWIILLGDNGVGKTTLLQCIALALFGSWLNALLASSKVPSLVRMENAGTHGRMELTVGGHSFEAEVKAGKGAAADRIVSDRQDMKNRLWPERPATFGYGVGRGNCAAMAAENLSAAPENSVDTLFDARGATMVDPSAFLRKLEGNASRAKAARLESPKAARRAGDISPEERLYKTVCNVLTTALGLSDLSVDNEGVYAVHKEQGRVPLDALSSGYYALARWLLDLLARYADFMTSNGGSLVENFHEHMRAIVLVDEIDLYLHPSWQHRVIEDLRKLFPETTFVVTTHNPLCLLGALPGEIFVLRRDEDTNRIEAIQKDLPRGISPDEVLTGEWFDLPPKDTIDNDTAGLMEEHRQLLRIKKMRVHQQRRLEEVERLLTERLKVPFDSPSIRNLLWAASELSEQERKAMDPLDAIASMSKDELRVLIAKARKLASGNA